MTDSTARTPAADDSGRFPIEGAARTMLPPANHNGGDVLSLEDLGGTVVEPAPRTAPPPPPPRAAAANSGVFPSGKRAADPAAELADFAEKLISLSPIYGPTQTAQAERAVLEVEDLSLRPDNPYLASSLVPPSEPRRGSRALLWAVPVVAAALAAGGWAAWSSRAPVERPASVARQAAPAPLKTAVPAAVTGPVAQPVVESTVAAAPVEQPAVVESEVSAQVPTEASVPVPAAHAAPKPRPAVAAATPAVEPPVAQAAAPAVVQATPTAPSAVAPVAPSATAEELPLTPTREQVAAGFEAVRAQLAQCAAGQHGVAQLAVTIAGTGRISHALVEGAFAGTPEGSCMARTVRAAHFPRFGQPSLKVAYPVAF